MRVVFLIISCFWSLSTIGQTLIFADFNTNIPPGWTIQNGGTTSDTWYRTTALFGGNSLDGTQFMFVNSDAAGNSPTIILSEILESPSINANPYPTVLLEFDHYYRDYSQDSGFVEVFNGTSWVQIASYSSNQGGWGAPSHVTLNLTPYRNANMKVRFRYEDNAIWAWYWAVDNIRIHSPAAYDGKMLAITDPITDCGLTTSEAVTLSYTNVGTDTLSTYTLYYQINNGATISEPGVIPVLPQDTLSHTFSIAANLSQSGIYTFKAWISATGDPVASNDTVSGHTVRSYPMASYPYVEDFEGSQPGWFAEGTNSTWILGTPAKDVIIGASSGTKAWVTGGLGTTNHLDNDDSWVISRCLDLSGASLPEIAMDIWWNSEFSWDGAALQYSPDLGANWVTIGVNGEPDNWYNDNSIDGAPGGQNLGWSGRNASGNGSGGWVTARHKIYALGGLPKVIFRVAFGSDGSVTDDGFAFDDFKISETPFVSLGNDTIVCDSMVLNAGTWASYAWNTGSNSQTLAIDSSGIYSVSVTDQNGFIGVDEVEITVINTQNIHLGNDTLLCPGEILNLYAGAPAVAYQWSTGSTSSQVTAQNAGNYAVTVTYAGGCQGLDDIQVSYSPLSVDFLPGNDTVCRGVPIAFTNLSSGANGVWWDFGDGNFSANLNPLHTFFAGGSFPVTLTVEDSNCTIALTQWLFADICTQTLAPSNGLAEVWPNPFQDRLNLQIPPDLHPREVLLYSVTGNILQKWEWPTGSLFFEISTDRLSSGAYLIQIIDENGTMSIPVIRQ